MRENGIGFYLYSSRSKCFFLGNPYAPDNDANKYPTLDVPSGVDKKVRRLAKMLTDGTTNRIFDERGSAGTVLLYLWEAASSRFSRRAWRTASFFHGF